MPRLVCTASAALAIAAAPQTASATTRSTLVLFDTSGQWGYLGEMYGMMAANLAGHFGTVTAEPVSKYASGQIESYTAVIYIGSTYYGSTDPNGKYLADQIPTTFYSEAASTTKPIIWMGYNIWNWANQVGVGNFLNKYGWDPTTSYYDNVGANTVVYKSQKLTRSIPSDQDFGILDPNVITSSIVKVLARAEDTKSSPVTTTSWAVRSGNLTYIGEIPFDYAGETDRLIAFSDLLFDALAPGTINRHRATIRLEDINPMSDPSTLVSIGSYLQSQNVPFAFNVIPVYTDPRGYYNGGQPVTLSLAQSPKIVQALQTLISDGGTIVEEGYTHQYSNVKDPFDGVTGDDCEFFMSNLTSANKVVFTGPTPVDSASWARGRLSSGLAAIAAAGLPRPRIWATPHYVASYTDYLAFKTKFQVRYDRGLYFTGMLTGGPINNTSFLGQYFPYVVTDIYGIKVLPENMGDYEPTGMYGLPPRKVPDLVNEAKLNLAIRDSFAAMFYDPEYGVAPLKTLIPQIKALGYTYVSPGSL